MSNPATNHPDTKRMYFCPKGCGAAVRIYHVYDLTYLGECGVCRWDTGNGMPDDVVAAVENGEGV